MINIASKDERDGIITDLMPDLTPLIDVMFMLIIFLVLTTNSLPRAFDIDLPEDKQEVTDNMNQNDVVVVTIFKNSEGWAIGDKKIKSFKQLKAEIIKEYEKPENKKIAVFSDKKAEVEKLLQLLTFMRSKGIEAADIVMDQYPN